MAIEAVKGAGMAYQGSVSTAQTSVQAAERADVSSEANRVVSADIAEAVQAMNPKATSGDLLQDDAAAQQQKEQNAQIRKAVSDINNSAAGDQAEAVFGIHEKTNRVTIKIVDKKSKEVIKEFPPEKTLDMIAKVWEMAGIMVDERR